VIVICIGVAKGRSDVSVKPSQDPREIRIRALIAAVELYTGLEEGRYLVYDKKGYRFYEPSKQLMAERRKALDAILTDVRGRHH